MSMMTTMTLGQHAKYGAIELKSIYQKYHTWALILASGIHLVIIGTYFGIVNWGEEEPPMAMVRIMKYSDLGPPPSLQSANTPPPIAVNAPTAKPSIGAPVPVPDAEVSAEQTLATQQEMSQVVSPIMGDGLGDGGMTIQQDIIIEDDAPPADFVPVEKQPVIVKRVEPKYPELAMRAGLEGTVYVKIWVDKEGRSKQVQVMKSTAEIFNEPALDAAKQFVFTPAYMNNGPVSVWVSVPFKFKLADRR